MKTIDRKPCPIEDEVRTCLHRLMIPALAAGEEDLNVPGHVRAGWIEAAASASDTANLARTLVLADRASHLPDRRDACHAALEAEMVLDFVLDRAVDRRQLAVARVRESTLWADLFPFVMHKMLGPVPLLAAVPIAAERELVRRLGPEAYLTRLSERSAVAGEPAALGRTLFVGPRVSQLGGER